MVPIYGHKIGVYFGLTPMTLEEFEAKMGVEPGQIPSTLPAPPLAEKSELYETPLIHYILATWVILTVNCFFAHFVVEYLRKNS